LPPRLWQAERKHTILQLSADFRLVDLASDRIEGERTSCGIREVRIGGKFCRSKSCATLMASTIRDQESCENNADAVVLAT
jgi:hypothetical protein